MGNNMKKLIKRLFNFIFQEELNELKSKIIEVENLRKSIIYQEHELERTKNFINNFLKNIHN